MIEIARDSERLTMSDTFDRRRHRFPESRYFEDLAVGERFYIPSRTVTEANFAAFQTVSADNHPIHYDVEYCRERGHPGPAGARVSGIVLHRGRGRHLRPCHRRFA